MEQFLKIVDEVTPNDIASVAQKLLSSPLTMASHGDGNFVLLEFVFYQAALPYFNLNLLLLHLCLAVLHVPSYDEVSRKFQSK